MIRVFIYTRDGQVIPVKYTNENQLQINAEQYTDVIFFFAEETCP